MKGFKFILKKEGDEDDTYKRNPNEQRFEK